MEFIEFRLMWEGRIRRADIADRFHLTVQQASADLSLYEEHAPTNMIYLRGPKYFAPAPGFRAVFLREKADRQLLQMAAICAGHIQRQDTWFDELPPMAAVQLPTHHVETETMAHILRAIREGISLTMVYQSMKRPEPLARVIEPHALGHDGHRWHVRAFCERNRDFRDFAIARIERADLGGPATIDPQLDAEWNDRVTLVFAPNPELKDGARKAVAKQYKMERGRLRIEMRAALVFYTIKQMNLDIELPAERKSLVLTNLDDVLGAVERATENGRNAVAAAAQR